MRFKRTPQYIANKTYAQVGSAEAGAAGGSCMGGVAVVLAPTNTSITIVTTVVVAPRQRLARIAGSLFRT